MKKVDILKFFMFFGINILSITHFNNLKVLAQFELTPNKIQVLPPSGNLFQGGAVAIRGYEYPYLAPYDNNSVYSSDKKANNILIIDVNGDADHVVQVFNFETKKVYTMLYIGKGKMARILLPSGTYKIKCAVGKRWFGEEQLFGSKTYYYQLDEEIKSTETATGYTTFKVTLRTILQESENKVSEQAITADEFEPPK